MQTSKNIHFFLNEELSTFISSLNMSQFRRRYPGSHIAIHIGQAPVKTNCFDDQIFLDISEYQKISFSPVLGDEIALNIIFKKLAPLLEEKYSWGFNLFGSKVCTRFKELFQIETTLGFKLYETKVTCEDPSLRLLRTFRSIDPTNSLIISSLLQKSVKQFDQENFRLLMAETIEHKFSSQLASYKKIIIQNRATSSSAEDDTILANVASRYSLLSQMDMIPSGLIYDATLCSNEKAGIDISSLDVDEVFAKITLSVVTSINHWFTRLIFAEYLGLTKTSFTFERVIATYPRELLQEYMIRQIGELKDFVALIILSERQKSNSSALEAIAKHSRHLSPLSLVLSIHSSQANPGDEADAARIDTLKNRLRNLNSLYERIYRLCSIDIPKTDLALTL